MSRTKPRDLEDLALWYACDFCNAPVRGWCHSLGQAHWATFLHSTRMWPVQQAYSLGSQETDDSYRDHIRTMDREQLLAYHQRLLEGKRW